MSQPIRFPAIEISNTFNVVDCITESASTVAWRKGFFTDLAYFDSDGRLWQVTAVPTRPATLLDRLLNSQIKATVTWVEFNGNGMAEAKRRLCAMIENDPDDLYDQFVEHDDFKTLIMAAATPAELIKLAKTRGAESELCYDNTVCAECEHDLRGGHFEKCPECGTATQRSTRTAA
jgi:hypothetical protein